MRLSPVPAFLCGVSLVALGAEAATPTFDEQLKRAGELLATKPKAALEAFSELERSNQPCAVCLLGMATAQNTLGRSFEAETAARSALELLRDPAGQAAAWTAIGVSFYNRTPMDASRPVLETNMRQAEAAFRRALELDTAASEPIRWNLASALEWLGQDDEARALFSDHTYVKEGPIAEEGREKVKKPVPISRVRPEYSARAKFQRIEGTVVLESIIGTDGVITSSRVVQGLRGCTVQAIRAARQWRFEPATFEGRPVPVYFTLTVNFALSG